VQTLGLTGLGSRLRALQHDCSTTARSPSGEHHPPMSRRAMAPLLRSVGTSDGSLARSFGWRQRRGRKKNDTRVRGGAERSAVLMCRESRVTVHRRWMARSFLGQIQPRCVSEIRAQVFTALCDFACERGQTRFGLCAGYGLRFSLKIFLFSETVISLVN
jgi:hypothetical protein